MSQSVTVADEGAKVVMVIDGRRCEMPPEIATQLSRVLYAKAKVAEEYANANRIIMDQAIMQRAGMPFGLSTNKKIVEAAKQEAQWNSELRRNMPLKGIEPKGIVGTPALIKQPRKVANG